MFFDISAAPGKTGDVQKHIGRSGFRCVDGLYALYGAVFCRDGGWKGLQISQSTADKQGRHMDLDGNVYPFTDAEAADPEFSVLLIRSANAYTFAADGYGPYFSANLSITKEIGDHVSLSFFANNFTNSRMAVKSLATGVSAIFTPDFYYGLTCRLKF